MENPVDFDDLVNDVENDETDRVDPITRLVDEGTERPYSNSKLKSEATSSLSRDVRFRLD